MKIEGNVISFDTDDELLDYCLSPNPEIFPHEINGQTYYGYDYPWTEQYNMDIKAGKLYKVNDENSLIMKHKAVNRGMVTKKLSNIAD